MKISLIARSLILLGLSMTFLSASAFLWLRSEKMSVDQKRIKFDIPVTTQAPVMTFNFNFVYIPDRHNVDAGNPQKYGVLAKDGKPLVCSVRFDDGFVRKYMKTYQIVDGKAVFFDEINKHFHDCPVNKEMFMPNNVYYALDENLVPEYLAKIKEYEYSYVLAGKREKRQWQSTDYKFREVMK